VKFSRLPFVRTIYLTAVLIALVGWTWLLFGMVALGAWPIITSTCAMGTNLSFDEEGLELRDMKAAQERPRALWPVSLGTQFGTLMGHRAIK
jgi:hypothetical protein